VFSKDWQVSRRRYGIIMESSVSISMSDRITIDADIFRPDSPGKFPALLGVHPYDKEVQSAPIMPMGLNMANGGIEAGDYNFYVRRGYVQVIANIRGSGKSGGHYLNYGLREVQDTAEVIEWIANQSWCDGKVGMFGVSAFAVAQQQVAALKPPRLKAIFAPFGYTDFYRDKFYHGGILSHAFMQGWTITIDNMRYESWCREKWGQDRYQKAIAQALQDKDIREVPYLVEALKNPTQGGNGLLVDILLNPMDGDYFQERSVHYEKNLEIPAYHGGCWGIYGLHLPGAFRSWVQWKGPKKMIIGPPIYLDRPLFQYQYESLRWFDYWLKGVENGIMEEPPIALFVEGTGEWKTATEWPLPETRWTPFYLHSGGLLSEHEFWPNEGSSTYEDSLFNRGQLTFMTPTLIENTEVIGPIVLNLYASTTDTEILWFVSLLDIDPQGNETLLTRGWLRGSQRELDMKRSKPWQPFHSHFKREPLTPNEIYEFNIEIRPYGILYKAGHRIGVRIKSVDDEKPTNFLQAIGMGHLWRQSASRVTVYHNSESPSHLLLPVTRGNRIGTYMSGGKLSEQFFPYRKF
jgi:predicted acyl esterase